jgi:hypothetical protein
VEALTLFHQNFAVAESLLQLYQLFHGLGRFDMGKDLHLAICAHWQIPAHTIIQQASNDRVAVLARSTTRIAESLTLDGGLDFLLRQAVVVACTCIESFFWDALGENVLTIIKARHSGSDEVLKNITLKLGDYISIQQYDDPDLRLRQIILNNSTVVICHAETPMLPLDHAESADQDKGVCEGMADCCPGSHRHCARRGISRAV